MRILIFEDRIKSAKILKFLSLKNFLLYGICIRVISLSQKDNTKTIYEYYRIISKCKRSIYTFRHLFLSTNTEEMNILLLMKKHVKEKICVGVIEGSSDLHKHLIMTFYQLLFSYILTPPGTVRYYYMYIQELGACYLHCAGYNIIILFGRA